MDIEVRHDCIVTFDVRFIMVPYRTLISPRRQ